MWAAESNNRPKSLFCRFNGIFNLKFWLHDKMTTLSVCAVNGCATCNKKAKKRSQHNNNFTQQLLHNNNNNNFTTTTTTTTTTHCTLLKQIETVKDAILTSGFSLRMSSLWSLGRRGTCQQHYL
jgi:hypothetical protein